MARLRPGRCYTKKTKKPYTRISMRKPRKSYVKGVPASKIHQFEVGDVKGNFPVIFHLISKDDVQIRSNALESARVTTTKHLTKKLGTKNFFLKIRVYPHHVLRFKPLATGAGADRFSQGMRRAFGKPIGVSARVKKNQKILTVRAPANSEIIVKESLKRASSKVPCSCKIVAD
ncbi:MAG: 50S ribosomal protein L16 [Candidatus Aenigmatarchaeota archaeon]